MSAVADPYQLSFALSLLFILLVPFAIAGLALLNTGLGRSRSAAHAITSALCVAGVAVLIYFAFGATIQQGLYYLPPWSWAQPKPALVSTGLFLSGLTFGTAATLPVLFMLFSVALCSLIPLGAAS